MTTDVYTSRGGAAADAWSDLVEGVASWRIWINLAWEEFHSRYRRSYLGVAWVVAQYVLFCTMIALFFGGGRAAPEDAPAYGAHVYAGYLGFSFISACMLDGCAVFTGAEKWLKSARSPFTLFVLKGIVRNLISFGYLAAVALGVIVLVYGARPTPAMLMLIPAVAIYVVNAVWVYFVFGLIAARVRDFIHFVQAIMRLMLFITPIIWVPASKGGLRAHAATWNPLAHFVEIIRQPLIAGDPGWDHWLVVLPITIAGCLVAFIAFAASRRRIIYWLQA